ncbi:hypothetical protein OROGR_007896 [Orobanche gracilis]
MPQNPFHLILSLLIVTFPTVTLCTGEDGDPTVSLTSIPADADALLAFKSEADLDNKLLYTTNERFDYCQWRGVKCSRGRVVRYVVPSSGLRGTVPSDTLSRLEQLRFLSIGNNSLSGPLPDLSALVNLKTVSFDRNYFSGTFPLSILSIRRLLFLDLSHNNLNGSLPDNLTVLDRLAYLRLDSNRFHGSIPPLNQTTLQVFNVSDNNLDGPIPATPTLRKFSIYSFIQNPKLCGEILNKPCRDFPFFNSSSSSSVAAPSPSLLQNNQSQQQVSNDISLSQKNHPKIVGLVLGLITGTLILMAAVLSVLALIRKRREDDKEREQIQRKADTNFATDRPVITKNENPESPERKKSKPLQQEEQHQQQRVIKSGTLVFCSGEEEEEEVYTLEQLMKASAELLGRGTIGTTYKAVMDNQLIVSVKRLDACKTAATSGVEFDQYMESVGVLRHPNLVPVRAYFQAQQERLIIFDYQPNGSLFKLIHGSRSTRAKPLHWTSCLKIAEDVAQGLAYIHQASKYVHGNLKSSNVLLGPDFEACVTDYCVGILADTSSDDDPDTAGYRAPEIRKSARRATAKSDVYAFGVLLLELLTGKLPSQHPFLAPPDMPDWVRAMRDDDGGEDDARLRMLVELASMCSLTSPEQRPTMWQVLKMIMNVKDIMDDGSGNGC